jgi:hypothetical protein
VLAAAALVRPIALYLPAFFLPFLIVWSKSLKRAVWATVILLGLFALLLMPWFWRNYRIFGSFSFSTSSAYNLLVLHTAPMLMKKRGQDFAHVKEGLLAETDEMMRQEGRTPEPRMDFAKHGYWRRLALRYITDDPWAFGVSFAEGVLRTFINLESSSYARLIGLPSSAPFDLQEHHGALGLVQAFVRSRDPAGLVLGVTIGSTLLAAYVALIVGLRAAWSRYPRSGLLFLAGVAIYFLILTGPAGLARFRLPAIPFYSPFAGIGCCVAVDRWRRRN